MSTPNGRCPASGRQYDAGDMTEKRLYTYIQIHLYIFTFTSYTYIYIYIVCITFLQNGPNGFAIWACLKNEEFSPGVMSMGT